MTDAVPNQTRTEDETRDLLAMIFHGSPEEARRARDAVVAERASLAASLAAAALAITALRDTAHQREASERARADALAAENERLRRDLIQEIKIGPPWGAIASELTGHTVGDTCVDCIAIQTGLSADRARLVAVREQCRCNAYERAFGVEAAGIEP